MYHNDDYCYYYIYITIESVLDRGPHAPLCIQVLRDLALPLSKLHILLLAPSISITYWQKHLT